MLQTRRRAAVALASLALAGCGGGGGDSGSSGLGPRAEGAYEGNTSTGRQFQALVLDDDQFWAMYGTLSGGTFYVAGFLQGQGASSSGSFTSANLKDFGYATPLAGTLAGSYVSGVSLNGTLSSSAGSSTFTGTAIPASRFDYNAPANLSAITGAWTLTALDGSTASLTISSAGALSGTNAGCSFSGTITPRGSGKNVFNFSLTFGASPCVLPGQSASGIALTYLVNGGPTRQLIVAGADSTRSKGTALFGTR